MAAKAEPSIRSFGQRHRAQVGIGDASRPFGAGTELGAIRNIPRRTRRGTVRGWNQFRPRNPEGYVVGKAVGDNVAEGLDIVAEGMNRLLRRAFPD